MMGDTEISIQGYSVIRVDILHGGGDLFTFHFCQGTVDEECIFQH